MSQDVEREYTRTERMTQFDARIETQDDIDSLVGRIANVVEIGRRRGELDGVRVKVDEIEVQEG